MALGRLCRPAIQISGIHVNAATDNDVALVLDWGEAELRGTIIDGSGRPVAGAKIELVWRHDTESMQSRSIRRTVADSIGEFFFSGLGPGVRALAVRSDMHKHYHQLIDAGTEEIDVQLVPLENSDSS